MSTPSVRSTTSEPTPEDERRSGITLWVVTRVLLSLYAVSGIGGVLYFTFVAAPEDGGVANAFDVFVGVWKLVVSVGIIVVAAAPGLARARRSSWLLRLVAADLVFGLVKIVGYEETESIGIFVTSVVLAGLLLVCARPSRP